MFLRTCLKCGQNLYSAGEYTQHLKEAHGKGVAKSELSEARKVKTGLTDTGQDVPEEILVKPKKVKEDKPTVAKTRKRRKKAVKVEEPAAKSETTTDGDTTTEAPKKPRTRRTRKKAE